MKKRSRLHGTSALFMILSLFPLLLLHFASGSSQGDLTTQSTVQLLLPNSTTHLLNVHVPPSFVKRPQNISELLVPQTARFECEVTGVPEPTVKWLKDGQSVYINGRLKMKSGSNTLVILQTVANDSGIYQCVATNDAGAVSAEAVLLINASINQPDPPVELKARTLSSSQIHLTWETAPTTNDQQIQAYSIHYMPSNGGLHNYELQTVVNTNSIIVDKLKASTNYTFYVRAYNDRSVSEQSQPVVQLTWEDVPTATSTASEQRPHDKNTSPDGCRSFSQKIADVAFKYHQGAVDQQRPQKGANATYPLGTVISFRCSDDSLLLEGNRNVTCDENGQWVPLDISPHCIPHPPPTDDSKSFVKRKDQLTVPVLVILAGGGGITSILMVLAVWHRWRQAATRARVNHDPQPVEQPLVALDASFVAATRAK